MEVWSFWVGSLHEFVGWFLGRVPLDHLPSANITIDAAAASNGQFGIAHEVLRLAVPTDKVIAKGERWVRIEASYAPFLVISAIELRILDTS